MVENVAEEGTVQYKIRFSIPLEEEDWLYNYLLKEPSRLIPLYEFVHHARTAFNDIVCYDEYSDPAEFDVQGLTPYDWYSWAIRAVGDDVEEALQQMIDDEGELPEPIEKHVDKTKHADTAAAFKYIILQHYPKVHNPMPDCMTDDVRMPENRFLRTLAQLWGSINPWNTKQQRFTYWIYCRYEHHFWQTVIRGRFFVCTATIKKLFRNGCPFAHFAGRPLDRHLARIYFNHSYNV